MSISSQQRTWILVGVLVIIGAGALVYFDPLGLNLLGEKPGTAVAKPAPAAKPVVAKPAAPKPPDTKLIGAVAAQLAAPVAASAPEATPAAVAPSEASSHATAMSAAASETATPAGTSAQMMPPPMRSAATIKTDSNPAADKPIRPKNLDLRHCLELDSNAAIAKCAGE